MFFFSKKTGFCQPCLLDEGDEDAVDDPVALSTIQEEEEERGGSPSIVDQLYKVGCVRETVCVCDSVYL